MEQKILQGKIMNKKNAYIINCGYERINYGAVITAFALQKILKDNFGIASQNIDMTPFLNGVKFLRKKGFDNFKDKYMNFSDKIYNKKELYALNNNAYCFITGSDQVFRIPFVQSINNGYETFFLDFVDINTKKIAVAASLGVEKEQFLQEVDSATLEKMRHSFATFDYISVREKSGVDICRDILNVEAKWIIDPVFWLDKAIYTSIASEAKKNYSGKIISYFLSCDKSLSKELKKISKKYGGEIKQIFFSDMSVEEWLNAVNSCKLFITNSFHGMCFAIIFNKPFICMVNPASGKARNTSVLEMLGIENKLITSFNEIFEKDCVFQYDFDKVNENISLARNEAIRFLKEAISSEHIVTKDKLEHALWIARNRILECEKEDTIKWKLKHILWYKWTRIYHEYLPIPLKIIISFVYKKINRRKKCK